MIKKTTLFLLGVLLTPISYTYAATEHTDININVIHDEYVRIIGSAAGSSRFYSNEQIANWIFPNTVDIGTIGLESNIAGDCDLNVSTLNNFQLLHTVNSEKLTKFKVIYGTQEFSETSNSTLTLPCNSTPSQIQFAPTELVFGNLFPSLLIATGTYSDTITLVITTQ